MAFHSVVTRQRLSAVHSGSGNPFYGRHHTPEVLERMRARTRIQNLSRRYDLAAPTIQVLPPEVAGYVAGLIDGEGSVVHPTTRPAVVIYNSSLALMEWLGVHVGGSWRLTDRRGRQPGYTWTVAGARDVYALLAAVSHLLVIKQPAAAVARAFLLSKYGERLYG